MSVVGGAGATRSAPDDTAHNPFVDLVRVVAIFAVVVGHWVATGVIYKHGTFDGVDVLGVVSWTSWLTLIFQVVPLFFLVGGYANAGSWTRHRATGGSAFGWVHHRACRLLMPTASYVAVVSLAVITVGAVGVNRGDLEQAAWALALHLWFLAVYLVLLLLTPALFVVHRRFGARALAVAAALAVVVDVSVIDGRWHVVGWLNYVLVWGIFHQLGFAWHEGFFAGRRGRSLALATGATSALVALIWWGPYPVSMVGVPGARIQNASPPSAALLAFGLAQVGVLLLVASPATSWLTRPGRVHARKLVERANAMTMPVYLWHMVPVVLVTVVAYPNRLLAQPSIGTGAWWLQRIMWIATLMVVLVGVLAIVVVIANVRATAPIVRWPLPTLRGGVAMAVFGLGLGLCVAALGRMAVQGFAPSGSFDVVTVGAFAAGMLLVAAARPGANTTLGVVVANASVNEC